MDSVNEYVRSLFKKRAKVTGKWTQMWLNQAKIFFKRQPLCIPEITLDKFENLVIIGDMHGEVSNLQHILKINEGEKPNFSKLKKTYVLMGDAIDKGPFSFEIAMAIFVLCIHNPKNFFFCRGNHEDIFIPSSEAPLNNDKFFMHQLTFRVAYEKGLLGKISNEEIVNYLTKTNQPTMYSFREVELKVIAQKFKSMKDHTKLLHTSGATKIINLFKEIYCYLPYAFVVKILQRKIFLVHGGIAFGQYLDESMFEMDVTIEKINKIKKNKINELRLFKFLEINEKVSDVALKRKIREFYKKQTSQNPEEIGLDNFNILEALVWSDVGKEKGVQISKYRPPKFFSSDAFTYVTSKTEVFGVHKMFGPDVTKKFMKANNIDLIIRGHQPIMTIYKVSDTKTEELLSYRLHEEHDNKVITIHSNWKHWELNKKFNPRKNVESFLTKRVGAYLDISNIGILRIYVYGDLDKKEAKFNKVAEHTKFQDIKYPTFIHKVPIASQFQAIQSIKNNLVSGEMNMEALVYNMILDCVRCGNKKNAELLIEKIPNSYRGSVVEIVNKLKRM